eukprot:COSAG01_NODE_4224_length_5226_cov_4.995514_5_plen_354_part_00
MQVSWGKDGNVDTGAVSEGATANIDLIKRYSPFKTEEALLNVFAKIDGSGTAIVIYNLRREEDGNLELDFESNSEDIMLRGLRGQATGALRPYQRPRNNQSDSSEVPIDQSLREYCRVLYKEPRMQIVLRGKIVRTLRILKTTTRRKNVRYKPHASSQAGQQGAALSDNGYTITFGFQLEHNRHLYGIMLYHHNRLIYPYLRVGVQTQANEAGVGVLGVMEADFLDPTHNKQDFHDNQTWRRMLASLSEKLNMCGHHVDMTCRVSIVVSMLCLSQVLVRGNHQDGRRRCPAKGGAQQAPRRGAVKPPSTNPQAAPAAGRSISCCVERHRSIRKASGRRISEAAAAGNVPPFAS